MMIFKPNTSYALICQDEQLLNIIISYIIQLNIANNILPLKSIFNSYLTLSNTETPSNKKIVIATIEKDPAHFTNININDNYLDILIHIYNLNTDPTVLRNLKQKARFSSQTQMLNLILRLSNYTNITQDLIQDILNNKDFTTLEYYQCLISFIANTTENNLLILLNAFKHDFAKLCYLTGTLNQDPPAWIKTRYENQLNTATFKRNLLKVSLIMLKAKSLQEFNLVCLEEYIY